MEFVPLSQQRLAIEAPKGPVLVVAGPGAGKTYCLIGRVDYLISSLGFAPARICAVTFTNKAAEEIAARLRHHLGERADAVTRGTLHALCFAILREYSEAAGLPKGFGVADEAYQQIVVRRLGVYPRWRRTEMLGRFGRRRLQGYALSDGEERLYQEYIAQLRRRNLVDFDDLIAATAALFRHDDAAAAAVASRWDYLLVDEFQDLNAAQYDVLRRLAQPHGNFFAVGDDEQSIFSWTGADPRVLERFRSDYGVTPIVLDKNHRCSRQIFAAARRLLAVNPQLFEKQLSAERDSAHEVRVMAFPDEEREAAWLLADLQADRAAHGLAWGDFAVLYRSHRIGDALESRFLTAGVPCRLARGRSLAEDEVVGYVIAALRVMREPGDPNALEAFARLVFAEHLIEEVRAAARGDDMLAAIRTLARARKKGDPDTRRLWRFLYQVENLTALGQSHESLPALVEELLSQSVGPYKNVLEDRHDELTDPTGWPGAVALAERLGEALAKEARVWIEPQQGLELALRGLLVGAGFRFVSYRDAASAEAPGPGDVVIRGEDGGADGLALTLFKALQLLQEGEGHEGLGDYVAFDLETTDNDVALCGVVEIGAARVVGGKVVDRFHALVRPTRAVSAGAQAVHGYSAADLRDAPPFAAVWPRFRAFVGADLLVAHNGLTFDIPVLRREAAGLGGVDELVFFDTLPLARSLSRGGAGLGDLAARFGIDRGRAHHALDDAVTLAQVAQALDAERKVRSRKAVLSNLLDYVALGLALDPGHRVTPEHALLTEITRVYALGRFSDCLEFYEGERARAPAGAAAPPLDEVIDRLGGHDLMERLRAEPDPAAKYPQAVARLRGLMAGDGGEGSLHEQIERLLNRVALSTSDGAEVDPERVNLLTLHSTKGLEFSRVYIVGVEDDQIPGWRQIRDGLEDEIQEARRLLYVGMTRAQDRLVLTRVAQRFGNPAGGSRFLGEMGLAPSAASAE